MTALLSQDTDERSEDACTLGGKYERQDVRIDWNELSLAARAAHQPPHAEPSVDHRDDGRARGGGLGTDEQIVAAMDAVFVRLDLGAHGYDRLPLEGARELRFGRHHFTNRRRNGECPGPCGSDCVGAVGGGLDQSLGPASPLAVPFRGEVAGRRAAGRELFAHALEVDALIVARIVQRALP